MNTRDLIRLGEPVGEPLALAHEFIQNFIAQGDDGAPIEAEVFNIGKGDIRGVASKHFDIYGRQPRSRRDFAHFAVFPDDHGQTALTKLSALLFRRAEWGAWQRRRALE